MTTNPLLALGEVPFILILEYLDPKQLYTLQRVSKAWHTFISDSTALWSGVLRRAGVDLDEWRQVLFESAERERITAWNEEKRQATLAEAIELLGDIAESTPPPDTEDEVDEDGQPLIISFDYDYDYMPEPKPEIFLHQQYPTKTAEYRVAYKSHLELKAAWEGRLCYETLTQTPSFRLRRIYVDGPYLFAFSKAWYCKSWRGRERDDREKTEDLHVLDKYSGKLLMTVPGLMRYQAHAVGAGYVLTSANEQDMEDDYEEFLTLPPLTPVGQVSVFRTQAAHDRTAELAKLLERPQPREYRTDLPLQFVRHLDALADCMKYKVKLVGGEAVVCGISTTEVVLVWLENECRVERWAHHLKEQLGYGDEPDIRFLSVEFDERYIIVVTYAQAHVFTPDGVRIASFPDANPSTVPCQMIADIARPWPYTFPKSQRPSKVPPYVPGPRAPPEFRPAATTQNPIVGYRPQSGKYKEMVLEIQEGPEDDLRWAPDFKDAIMTDGDLVVWSGAGFVLVVQKYRRVFGELAGLNERDRTEHIAQHSVALRDPKHIDCLVAYGGRIHGIADMGMMWSIDLKTLPQLPTEFEPIPLPDLTLMAPQQAELCSKVEEQAVWAGSFTNYDVSCMADLTMRSWIAVDARAAYMIDWDPGFPGGGRGGVSLNYESLFGDELRHGIWPWPIRPAFGHVKMWVHRPHASVLWTEHSRNIGMRMGIYDTDLNWGQPPSDSDFDSASDTSGEGSDGGGVEPGDVNEQNLGIAALLGEMEDEAQDDGPDVLDAIAEALMGLGTEPPVQEDVEE